MKERNLDFTEGKILQPLIMIAVPVLFAIFLQAMYGAVDVLVVGKFAGAEDVSAVSTGSQIMMTITGFMSRIEPVSLFHIGLATPCSTVVQIILCFVCYARVVKKIKQ